MLIAADPYCHDTSRQQHSPDHTSLIRPVSLRFLSLCEQYGLLSRETKAATRLDGQEPLDQNTKRQQKVLRFKREREIKAKMATVQMKRMRIAHIEAEVKPLRKLSCSLPIPQGVIVAAIVMC